MLNKFLKEVISVIVGKQAEDIVELINSKKHVNEFIIAKKLDITINQTRNILYKLSDHGIVSSIRKKDKRKGWYTYFWKIETVKALEFLRGILNKKIGQLTSQINSRELKDYYVCERCVIEVNEENALAYDFTCNECGDIFTIKDKTKDLKNFRKDLTRLQKELELVNVEMEKEQSIVEKKRVKEIEKVKKLKDEMRKKKREQTAKDKKKLIKKIVKKISKKKSVKKTAKKLVKKKILKKIKKKKK
ncbi:MAG: hypothetical protein AABX88_00545 [Nanoarchaeota archaeon]